MSFKSRYYFWLKSDAQDWCKIHKFKVKFNPVHHFFFSSKLMIHSFTSIIYWIRKWNIFGCCNAVFLVQLRNYNQGEKEKMIDMNTSRYSAENLFWHISQCNSSELQYHWLQFASLWSHQKFLVKITYNMYFPEDLNCFNSVSHLFLLKTIQTTYL